MRSHTLKYSTSPSLGSRLTRLHAFAPAVRLRGRAIIGVDVDELSRQLISPRFCLCVVPSLPAGALRLEQCSNVIVEQTAASVSKRVCSGSVN